MGSKLAASVLHILGHSHWLLFTVRQTECAVCIVAFADFDTTNTWYSLLSSLSVDQCQRIRDFFVDALYKSTFTYLLTYLQCPTVCECSCVARWTVMTLNCTLGLYTVSTSLELRLMTSRNACLYCPCTLRSVVENQDAIAVLGKLLFKSN